MKTILVSLVGFAFSALPLPLLAQAGPAASWAKPADDPELKAAADRAEKLFRAKQYEQAEKAYEAILASHPQGRAAVDARWGIAFSYRMEGKREKEIPVLEQILAQRDQGSSRGV